MEFEEAYKRLEEILEKMNSKNQKLDESLKLYEEAHQLFDLCKKMLDKAETRIEMILQNRDGSPLVDDEGLPKVKPFDS